MADGRVGSLAPSPFPLLPTSPWLPLDTTLRMSCLPSVHPLGNSPCETACHSTESARRTSILSSFSGIPLSSTPTSLTGLSGASATRK